MPVEPTPFFLDVRAGAAGRLFCLHHVPARPARALLIFVHAFAEEMNRSRRMVALQARQFAAAGFAVLQLDLSGCGDSHGDFGDAGWEQWLDDVAQAVRWARERHDAPLWLWGHRAGCLLASQVALDSQAAGCLFWQPAPQGKAVLQQFLRLKAAAGLQAGAGGGELAALRQQLAEGQTVEVAGYRLAPALALGLEAATLQAPAAHQRVIWLETSTRDPAALLPVSARVVQDWQAGGASVTAEAVAGPAFWQTAEIEDAPALLQRSSTLLAEAMA